MQTQEDLYGLLAFIFISIPVISLWGIFRKAGSPGWVSLIPLLNLYFVLKVSRRSPVIFFLFLTPLALPLVVPKQHIEAATGLIVIALLFLMISIIHSLARAFGKGIFFTLGMIFFGFIFFPVLALDGSQYLPGRLKTPHPNDSPKSAGITSKKSDGSYIKPPEIISNLIQPGLIAKIFTIFFVDEGMAVVKTGSGATNASGTLRAFHGGAGATANVMAGLGGLWDMKSAKDRSDYLGEVGGYDTRSLISENKANFLIPYDEVEKIEMKGPGWGGELKIKIFAKEIHKFRIDTRSDSLVNNYYKTFCDRFPGRVFKN